MTAQRSQAPAGLEDDATIREALDYADPTALRATLFHLTGDADLADMELGTEWALYGEIPAVVDEEAASELRERAFRFLQRMRSEGLDQPQASRERLLGALDLCACESVPEALVDVSLEEAGFQSRALHWEEPPPREVIEGFHVLVIGAGMSGLIAAVRLQEMGIPYTVVEKNAGVGGTWWQNTYPGARVDVPSFCYSYPWELDHPWTHFFAPQAEIQDYLEDVARDHGVLSRVRFGTEVVSARWNEGDKLWEVEARDADGADLALRANAIISAVGLLDRAYVPEIPGLVSFQGEVMHTSRWNHDYDVRGRRVAVIGTGASGMQLAPAIAPEVSALTIFQRTPAWVFQFEGYLDEIPWQVNWLREHLPTYANWLRCRTSYAFLDKPHTVMKIDPDWDASLGSVSPGNERLRQRLLDRLAEQLAEHPDLQSQCTPDYPPMTTRFVIDSGWFDMLKRENVTLCTDGIDEILPHGIRTRTGKEIPVDAIVLATGFRANDFLWPMRVEGRGGQTLDDLWNKDGARAHLGIDMPGFPNLYCAYGPNTNPSSGVPVIHFELQIRYALGCIQTMIERGYRSLDVRVEVFDDFQTRLDHALDEMVWMDPRARSYYRNEHGRVAVNSPWLMTDYWRWTRTPDLGDYRVD